MITLLSLKPSYLLASNVLSYVEEHRRVITIYRFYHFTIAASQMMHIIAARTYRTVSIEHKHHNIGTALIAHSIQSWVWFVIAFCSWLRCRQCIIVTYMYPFRLTHAAQERKFSTKLLPDLELVTLTFALRLLVVFLVVGKATVRTCTCMSTHAQYYSMQALIK